MGVATASSKLEAHPGDARAIPDARNQELAGLMALAIGGIYFAAVLDGVDLGSWLFDLPSFATVLRALIPFNVAALGLLILIAGLQGHRVGVDRSVARGVLVKLAAANLLLPVFVLADSAAVRAFVSERPALTAVGLLVWLVAARGGLMLLRRGWKFDAPSADELLAEDPRAPVVYLRSFVDDDPTGERSLWRRAWRSLRFYPHLFSLEQELAAVLGRVGPVVAIGRPGESMPELGAARLYVTDDAWRARVIELITAARLVVIRAGASGGVRWELEQALRLLPPGRLLVLFPDPRLQSGDLRALVEGRFGPIPAIEPGEPRGMVVLFPGTPTRPEAIALEAGPGALTTLLSVVRPYRDPIENALRRAFARLGLPWVERKSRATAALLALAFGWFGAHWFYLGERWRGRRYLWFCWALVPIFVGWYDLVRFILAGEAAFRERYPPSIAPPPA